MRPQATVVGMMRMPGRHGHVVDARSAPARRGQRAALPTADPFAHVPTAFNQQGTERTTTAPVALFCEATWGVSFSCRLTRRIANRCQSSSIAGRVHARAEATHRSNAEVGLPHGELAISLPMRRSPRS